MNLVMCSSYMPVQINLVHVWYTPAPILYCDCWICSLRTTSCAYLQLRKGEGEGGGQASYNQPETNQDTRTHTHAHAPLWITLSRSDHLGSCPKAIPHHHHHGRLERTKLGDATPAAKVFAQQLGERMTIIHSGQVSLWEALVSGVFLFFLLLSSSSKFLFLISPGNRGKNVRSTLLFSLSLLFIPLPPPGLRTSLP